MSAQNLAGQHVVVIGGTSGIGRAVVEHSLAAGARVTAAARTTEGVSLPDGAALEGVDLTSGSSVESLFGRIGAFDHLVLSAGPGAMGTVRDLPAEAARPSMDTKFWGYYEAVRAAAGRIAREGSITLVGGAASRKHAPGRPMMAAINAALEAFGKANAVAAYKHRPTTEAGLKEYGDKVRELIPHYPEYRNERAQAQRLAHLLVAQRAEDH